MTATPKQTGRKSSDGKRYSSRDRYLKEEMKNVARERENEYFPFPWVFVVASMVALFWLDHQLLEKNRKFTGRCCWSTVREECQVGKRNENKSSPRLDEKVQKEEEDELRRIKSFPCFLHLTSGKWSRHGRRCQHDDPQHRRENRRCDQRWWGHRPCRHRCTGSCHRGT